MSKDSVNVTSFVAGEGLGHIAAETAEMIHPRVATVSLVKTMMHVIESEPDEDAADCYLGAMLAFTDGLRHAAEKAGALNESESEDAPDNENKDDPLDALLADLCGALDDEGEG